MSFVRKMSNRTIHAYLPSFVAPNTLEKLEVMTILCATDLGSLTIAHEKWRIRCLEFAKVIVRLCFVFCRHFGSSD